MFKRWSIFFLLILASLPVAAQSTRVRGVVRDADTGEPLPFVGVYFDGTTIGISTDMNGRYSLETRSPDAKVLTAQLLGYESLSIPVNQGAYSEIDFSLRQDTRQLRAAIVKPDDHYIRSILRKLDRSLAVNDPDNAPDWHSSVYTKIEFDVTNLEDLLGKGVLEKNLGFVRDYSDTSAITGQTYIPAMISETLSDVYHSEDPSFNREVLKASRISGLNEDNVLRQFTGSYLLKTNFFKSSIDVFNLSIPNPAAATSHIFYNYYLVDSLQVEGRKTYVLRFRPKKLVTSPTLEGEFQVDAQDFGIRSIHASLSPSSNVNWIRHINMDIENRRLPDGRWFYGQERLFLDFSFTPRETSRLMSFLGHRNMYYSPPDFAPLENRQELRKENAVVERNVLQGDNNYWNSVRPYPLSAREQGIYDMVEKIQASTFYKWTYSFLDSFITSYIEIPSWRFEWGRWPQFVSANTTEGFRLKVGGRTLYTFSEKIRLSGYLAYGFKDRDFKWMAQAEWMLGRERTRKLTVHYMRDYVILGSGTGVWSVPNIFSTLITPNYGNRQTMVHQVNVHYEHEFCPQVNADLGWTTQRLWSNPNVPIYAADGSGNVLESLAVNQVELGIRLSIDERVNRNYFKKTYLYSRYPVLYLALTGGIKGILPGDIGFIRTEGFLQWKSPTMAIGYGNLNISGGAIFGTVPHLLLKLHEGNSTFFMDKGAFSCMRPYEFASDRWIQGYYEHNFNGFFLGKIPLIKELDLREVATVRFAWGDITPANKANLLQETGILTNPYVEVGVGISNILRILRVDCFWRLTHRLPEAKQNFSVNLGIDIDF